MRLAMLILMVGSMACVAGEPARRSRWPTHRKDKDQKIEELLTRVNVLEEEVAQLQKALKASTPPPSPPPAASP
jgi:hypothetical protein